MGRVSEEKKSDARYYLNKKILDPGLSDYCLSRDDVDTVILCIGIVKLSRLGYLKAKQDAPRNIGANIKAREKIWNDTEAKSEEDLRGIEAYLREMYPTYSDTKIVKDDVLGACKDILKDNGFGGKRIESIIPILTKIL